MDYGALKKTIVLLKKSLNSNSSQDEINSLLLKEGATDLKACIQNGGEDLNLLDDLLGCLQILGKQNNQACVFNLLDHGLVHVMHVIFRGLKARMDNDSVADKTQYYTEQLLETVSVFGDIDPSVKSVMVLAHGGEFLDVLLHEHMSFQTKMEMVKSTNTLLEQCPTKTKEQFLNIDTICTKISSLVSLVTVIGDYELQVGILECLIRIFPKKHRQKYSERLFTDSEMLEGFLSIKDTDFELDCRHFLNALNRRMLTRTGVLSIPCISTHVGSKQLMKPSDPGYDEFWVDFNIGSQRITLFCEQASLSSQQSGMDEDLWETVAIYKSDVHDCSLNEIDGQIVLEIILQRPVSEIYPSQHHSTGDKTITIEFPLEYETDLISAVQSTFSAVQKPKVSQVSTPIQVALNHEEEKPLASHQEIHQPHKPMTKRDNQSTCSQESSLRSTRCKVSIPCVPMHLPSTPVGTPVVQCSKSCSGPTPSGDAPASSSAVSDSHINKANENSAGSQGDRPSCSSVKTKASIPVDSMEPKPSGYGHASSHSYLRTKDQPADDFVAPKTPVGKIRGKIRVKTPVVTVTPPTKMKKDKRADRNSEKLLDDEHKDKMDEDRPDTIPDSQPVQIEASQENYPSKLDHKEPDDSGIGQDISRVSNQSASTTDPNTSHEKAQATGTTEGNSSYSGNRQEKDGHKTHKDVDTVEEKETSLKEKKKSKRSKEKAKTSTKDRNVKDSKSSCKELEDKTDDQKKGEELKNTNKNRNYREDTVLQTSQDENSGVDAVEQKEPIYQKSLDFIEDSQDKLQKVGTKKGRKHPSKKEVLEKKHVYTRSLRSRKANELKEADSHESAMMDTGDSQVKVVELEEKDSMISVADSTNTAVSMPLKKSKRKPHKNENEVGVEQNTEALKAQEVRLTRADKKKLSKLASAAQNSLDQDEVHEIKETPVETADTKEQETVPTARVHNKTQENVTSPDNFGFTFDENSSGGDDSCKPVDSSVPDKTPAFSVDVIPSTRSVDQRKPTKANESETSIKEQVTHAYEKEVLETGKKKQKSKKNKSRKSKPDTKVKDKPLDSHAKHDSPDVLLSDSETIKCSQTSREPLMELQPYDNASNVLPQKSDGKKKQSKRKATTTQSSLVLASSSTSSNAISNGLFSMKAVENISRNATYTDSKTGCITSVSKTKTKSTKVQFSYLGSQDEVLKKQAGLPDPYNFEEDDFGSQNSVDFGNYNKNKEIGKQDTQSKDKKEIKAKQIQKPKSIKPSDSKNNSNEREMAKTNDCETELVQDPTTNKWYRKAVPKITSKTSFNQTASYVDAKEDNDSVILSSPTNSLPSESTEVEPEPVKSEGQRDKFNQIVQGMFSHLENEKIEHLSGQVALKRKKHSKDDSLAREVVNNSCVATPRIGSSGRKYSMLNVNVIKTPPTITIAPQEEELEQEAHSSKKSNRRERRKKKPTKYKDISDSEIEDTYVTEPSHSPKKKKRRTSTQLDTISFKSGQSDKSWLFEQRKTPKYKHYNTYKKKKQYCNKPQLYPSQTEESESEASQLSGLPLTGATSLSMPTTSMPTPNIPSPSMSSPSMPSPSMPSLSITTPAMPVSTLASPKSPAVLSPMPNRISPIPTPVISDRRKKKRSSSHCDRSEGRKSCAVMFQEELISQSSKVFSERSRTPKKYRGEDIVEVQSQEYYLEEEPCDPSDDNVEITSISMSGVGPKTPIKYLQELSETDGDTETDQDDVQQKLIAGHLKRLCGSGFKSGPSSAVRPSRSALKKKYPSEVDDTEESSVESVEVSEEEEEEEQVPMFTPRELFSVQQADKLKIPSVRQLDISCPSSSSVYSTQDLVSTNNAGIAAFLQAFGADIKSNLMAKRRRIEYVMKAAMKGPENNITSSLHQYRKFGQTMANEYTGRMSSELQALENDIEQLRESERQAEEFFKKQMKTLRDNLSSQKGRIENIRSLQTLLDQQSKKLSNHNKIARQHMQEELKVEVKKLQQKLCQESLKEEKENVKKHLQALFQ